MALSLAIAVSANQWLLSASDLKGWLSKRKLPVLFCAPPDTGGLSTQWGQGRAGHGRRIQRVIGV